MARAPARRGRLANSPILHLTLARIRETVREPGVMFWVFGFPVLLSLGLGLAFRNRGPQPVDVGVLDGPGATALDAALTAAHFHVQRLGPAPARERLRAGKIAVLVVPGGAAAAGGAILYRYDPTRADGRAARDAVNDALQHAAGRTDPRAVKDEPVTQPGTRYIDFLIPGLIGMNLMSGSMWGIGWVIVNMRVRKLLKRLMATPMRRRDLLIAQALARLLSLPLEVATIVIFARVAFGVTVNGSLFALAAIAILGALTFAAMAILVASRAQNNETVSGLMNVVMMPMFVLSGVFFSAAHFPAVMQPLIAILPLTALNDGLRAVMIDGASLASLVRPLAVLAAWGVASFAIALRIFRWS
jgi:ABC-2 type transport system permease protein